jgi:DNA-binding response OmpR family regulator
MDGADGEIRVLFVEDDPALADMYRTKLELDGYLVDVARDGEEALARLNGELPDLVFMDVRLPKMNGIRVLEELRDREQTRHLPVVILSNYSDHDWGVRVRELGALEWLVKTSITPGQVSGQINGWTRTRQSGSGGNARTDAGTNPNPSSSTL